MIKRDFLQKKEEGLVALTVVLLITAILLATGISAVLTNVDIAQSSKNYLNKNLAEISSLSCMEEALNKVKYDTAYTGTITVDLPDGSCEATISINLANSAYRNIAIESTIDEYSFSREIIVNTAVKPIEIIK